MLRDPKQRAGSYTHAADTRRRALDQRARPAHGAASYGTRSSSAATSDRQQQHAFLAHIAAAARALPAIAVLRRCRDRELDTHGNPAAHALAPALDSDVAACARRRRSRQLTGLMSIRRV
ncbi:hypothetical protein GCM10020358_23520 [Amorphoplanes nipponensis]